MRRDDALAQHPARPISYPRLSALLHAIGLDAAYHRGCGDELFCRDDDGGEVAVLDLVGGYGSLLLGHNHPELVAELTRFLASGLPVHAQGSLRPLSERLAAELQRRVGGQQQVAFASTGAEAVEMAIKHAILATGGQTVIAVEGGFHGKSLGTLPLAGNPVHREPFERSGSSLQRVLRVRFNDVDHLEATFASAEAPAAFIFEPIQGEGGVRRISRAFAQRAAELCEENRIALIADECQSGMGRTGTFLACEQLGVRPGSVVLSKSLGGGPVKISALMIDRNRYQGAFDFKHTSTFAGDELSSAVALKVLSLTDEAMLAAVQARGARWLTRLRTLARRYPDVIADVRGHGLMLAIELRPLSSSPSFLLRMFSATDDLALLAAGYLLRAHRIRMAPTLSCPRTLRVQSSALITDLQIEHAINGLVSLCNRLRGGDAVGLTRHLAEPQASPLAQPELLRTEFKVASYRPGRVTIPESDLVRRVAWLCHLIDDVDLLHLEPAYVAWTAEQRGRLLDRLAPLANPVVMSEVDVRSVTGQTVRLYPILLPVTSAWMKRCLDDEAPQNAIGLVQKGVDLAEHLGCRLAALGQYTSIVTSGGRRLRSAALGLTTGNSYSLALALEALEQAQQQRGIDPSQATCAVVGASGNIGQTAARLLALRYRKTLLLGSPRSASAARLARIAGRLPRSELIASPGQLRQAQVILAATSAVDHPLRSEHLAEDAVVCDLSVPAAIADALHALRPDVMFIKGGIARLPFEEDLGIVGFPLQIGRTYGCMAEAILLSFEAIADRSFTGLVQPDRVRRIAEIARLHGFVLDQFKSGCVLGSAAREATHAGATR